LLYVYISFKKVEVNDAFLDPPHPRTHTPP
jgi:hypothetical protein